MNSQIVLVAHALKSKKSFLLITVLVPASLYFKAGFVSVVVLWFFAYCLYNRHNLGKPVWRLLYLLLVPSVFFVTSLMWSVTQPDAYAINDLMVRRIHLLLIPVAFAFVKQTITEEDINIILGVFLAGCVLCSLICVANATYNSFFIQNFKVVDFSHFRYFKFTEPVDIPPLYLSLFSNLAFAFIVNTRLVTSNSLRLCIALYIVIFIVLLGSVVGMVSAAIVALTTMVMNLNTGAKKMILWGSIAGFITGFLILFLEFENLKSSAKKIAQEAHIENAKENIVQDASARLAIWFSAIETISNAPVLGYGSVKGQMALEQTYAKNNFLWGVNASLNPHNEYLSVWLEFGIVGLLAFILMMFIPFVKAVRSGDRLLICFFIIIFLFFLVESVLARQKGVVFFTFFFSLLIKHADTESPYHRCNYLRLSHER